MAQETITKVEFNNGDSYYFGSLSAIFTKFTPNDIGANLRKLWNAGIKPGSEYKNNKCTITKHFLYRKSSLD